MKRNMSLSATLALVIALALPALALAAPAPQAPDASNNQAVATLKIGGGVIMVSRNNTPFVSGEQNQSLFSKERLMVTDNSSATVVYNDGCQQTYSKAGVYTISANCKAGVVAGISSPTTGTLISSPTTGTLTGGQLGVLMAATLVTGGLAGAVIKNHHCPPVSH